MRRLLAVGVLGGCGFTAATGSQGPADARIDAPPGALADAAIDAEIDAAFDAPLAMSCHGTFETVCIAQPIGANLDVNSPLAIDTDTSPLCQPPAAGSTITSACILARASFGLNNTLRATGSRPLILIATGAFTINGSGTLDVGSRGLMRGAGGRACAGFATPGSHAGGAGASFGTLGGLGGTGGASTSGSVPQTTALVDLVGGCSGIPGGSTAVIESGPGGLGGGAVLVIASSITVNGNINASGGGGGGGITANAGGGGGGAGGAVVLDTQNLTINGGGRVFAQGGGGGEGAGPITPGAAGGATTTANAAALGGGGAQSTGGDGGLGAVAAGGTPGSAGTTSGGGGGGGAGHIRSTDPAPTITGETYPTLVFP
jgi:hypothetical protein